MKLIKLLFFLGQIFGLYYFTQINTTTSHHAQYAKNSFERAPSSYNFGGSCVSKGGWVADALQGARELRNAVAQLKDSEDCLGLIGAIQSVNIERDEQFGQREKEINNQDLNDMANTMISATTAGRSTMIGALFGKTMENAFSEIAYRKTNPSIVSSSKYGFELLNNILMQAPNYQSCLQNQPDILQAIAASAVKIASAYTGGNNQFLGNMDKTFTNLISFFRNKHFANVLRGLDNSEYFLSLSCILESVTTNYCTAMDAQVMITELKKIRSELDQTDSHPFEGYLILTRDSNIISDWLLKVMFGVEPKLLQDADYKNVILDNITDFLQGVNKLKAQLNTFHIDLQALTNDEAKKTHIVKVVQTIVRELLGGYNRAGNGDVNFFNWTGITPELVPFYLIGIDTRPQETITSPANPVPMTFEDYVQLMGNNDKNNPTWLKSFESPDDLFETIRSRVLTLINKAEAEARSYFRQRFIIDIPNLVTETITNPKVTVKQSLRNIYHYLLKMYATHREIYLTDGIEFEVLSFIAKMMDDIKAILDSFDQLQKYVKDLVNINKEIKSLDDPALMEEINKLAESEEIDQQFNTIIDTVYDRFNILLQRDTYLQNRIETMVKFEFTTKIKNTDRLEEFQKYAMILAGNDAIRNVLSRAYGDDPTEIKVKLDTAMVAHMANMDSMEELFSNPVLGVINHLKGTADGEKGHNVKRFLKDSFFSDPYFGLFKPIVYGTVLRDRYFINNFSWKKPPSADNFYSSTKNTVSLLCLQALAFKDKKKFIDVCMDTGLYSSNGKNKTLDGLPLDENYNRLMIRFLSEIHEYNQLKKSSGLLGSYKKASQDLKRSSQKFDFGKRLQKARDIRRLSKDIATLKKARIMEIHDKEHICGFRNFLRRNKVYNLIRSFNDDDKEIR